VFLRLAVLAVGDMQKNVSSPRPMNPIKRKSIEKV
jgi:hypothetical protein